MTHFLIKNELGWLARQARPFIWSHLASLSCILIGSLLVLIDPLLMKWLIDDVLPHRDVKWLPVVAGAFLIAYAGRLLCDALGEILSYRANQKMIFKIRLTLLRHLQTLSAEYHDTRPVGETLYRLDQDVNQVGELGGDVLPSLLRMTTVLTLVTVAMLWLNVWLTCFVLMLIPAFLAMRHYYTKRLHGCSELVQEQSGRLSAFLQEHLSGIVQIQLLSRERTEARRFVRFAGNTTRAQINRRIMELTFVALSSFIVVIGITGILGYGGYQVITGSLSIGGLVAFYSYAIQLFIPLYGVVDLYVKFQRVSASVRRIMEITAVRTSIQDRPGALDIHIKSIRRIEMKGVSFWYQPSGPVIRNVSFRVQRGERVALVGISGSGKSTIAKLMARLYDVREGSVVLDGTDVRDIKLKSFRSLISFVPQDPVLFDATLRENILYGNPEATQAVLEEAAILTQLEEVIQRFPKGWDEPLGPRGGRLSGGERQRVALARAILQRPRILILDEATSALDASTEKSLLEGLEQIIGDTATLVISHRPAPILWADRVMVLNKGHIVEDCTHKYFSESSINNIWSDFIEKPYIRTA